MKNVMITGVCGHLGSYLIRNLDKKYNIVGVDNLLTQRYCSLFNLKRKNFKFLLKDYIDLTDEELQNIDVILHLANIVDAPNSFENEKFVWEENYYKTIEFFKKIQNKRIIMFSTTSVYGKNKEIVYENGIISPQSPYAITKYQTENFLKENIKNYIILRLATIFGVSSGIRFQTCINKFCWQASLNIPFFTFSENYTMYRPYLGLKDLCQVIELILLDKVKKNEIYNVLTDNFRLDNIVSIIKKYNLNTQLNFVDTPLLNQYSYKVNFDKIKKFGYKPKENLENEIKKTLRLLKNLS